MVPEQVIIIGNGAAALGALKTYRKSHGNGRVSLITDQGDKAYSPASLAKAAAKSTPSQNGFYITDNKFYSDMNAELVHDTPVEGIDLNKREVSARKGKYPFDKLLITTGSIQFVPDIDGLKECKWLNFRTLSDLEMLKKLAGSCRKAMVLGGGLVGLEAIDALHKLSDGKLDLTIIEREDRLMPNVLDKKASLILKKHLKAKGIKVFTGSEIVKAHPSSNGNALGCMVELGCGDKLNVDLLIVATGSQPNVFPTSGTGFEKDFKGINIDEESARTDIEGVWAAGDVAKHTKSHAPTMLWPAAVEQGERAGYDMAVADFKRRPGYSLVPYLAANILNLDTGYVGDPAFSASFTQENAELTFVDERRNIFRRLFLSDGKLRGVIALGETSFLGPAGSLIGRELSESEIERLLSGGNAYPGTLLPEIKAKSSVFARS